MGCLSSSVPNDEHMNMLPKNRKVIKHKLLMLGPGESGKSTLLRQLRKIYGQDFNESQLLAMKPHISENIISAMRTLAVYSEILHDQVDEQNEETRSRVARLSSKQPFTKQHCDDFHTLWNDIHIRNLLKLSHKFQLLDTCEYFFERMDNYWRHEYVPTFEDIIHTRQRTNGVHTTRFLLNHKNAPVAEIYDIWDAGGQKRERKNWQHLKDATAIIYVVALSGYNQTLWEESSTNRMKEAISLFGCMIKMDLFAHLHGILIFNKADLFYKKVGVYSVTEHFSDYTGSNDNAEEIIDFFKQKFMVQWKQKPNIYFHITCATDTKWVERMFESVRILFIKGELVNHGFL